MGRAPCCDKANVKRGPWSPEEDSKLKSYIDLHGTGGNWIALPQKIGLKRCGKSCRLRWLNYLRPNIKHGAFSEEEDNLICSLYISIGSRWSIIASQLPGRTDNDIKNYWNTRLKKKLIGKHRKEHQAMARRFLKQQEIIKKGLITSNGDIGNTMVDVPMALLDHQNPYWPELQGIQQLPLTHEYSSSSSNQEVGVPSFNDHASIWKLLIKLGGRFDSNHHENVVVQPKIQDGYQVPIDDRQFSSATQPIYHEGFAQMRHYNNNNNGDCMNMFQGGKSSHCLLSNELKDIVYNVDPEKLDGLEFLYNDEVITSSTTTRLSDEQVGNGWSGHIDQMELVYPPSLVASGLDYHEDMQRLLMSQEQCANGLSSYPGAGMGFNKIMN